MDTIQPTPVESTTPSRGIFGTAIPSSVSSVVAFLLFFLPFAEVRCKDTNSNNNSFMVTNSGAVFSNSGFGLALGLNWKSAMDGLGGDLGMNTDKSINNKQEPNSYALVAWLLALATAVLAMLKWKWGSYLSMVLATLSVAAMVGLYIDLKAEVNDLPGDKSGNSMLGNYTDVQTELVFTAWYYAAGILLLATAYFAYRRISRK